MPLRPPAGFIRPGYDPLKVPDAPTIGTATGGDEQATITFTAPTNVGGSAITQYTAVSTPDGLGAQDSASPLTVTGLTNGTSYTFAVWALNTYGPSPYSAASNSVTPQAPRGVTSVGTGASAVNVLNYVTISSTGNATLFGYLAIASVYNLGSCSSSTRGVFAGGQNSTNVIQYITIATTGDTSDFGDLTQETYGLGGCSSSTRGLFGGGFANADTTAVITYITIASTGNSTSFGNLTSQRQFVSSCSSSTRGIFAGGRSTAVSSGFSNIIDYVTIASTGNATDFGDLTVARYSIGACSNSTTGVFAGGGDSNNTQVNVIDYITIASTGNANDFGDLGTARDGVSACSSSTRGVFFGSYSGGAYANTIQYVTIDSTGNASNFGNLTNRGAFGAACSNAHGGL